MGLSDVDDMYSELEPFMTEKNLSLNPKPFPSLRRLKEMTVEGRLQLVAKFSRDRGHH